MLHPVFVRKRTVFCIKTEHLTPKIARNTLNFNTYDAGTDYIVQLPC